MEWDEFVRWWYGAQNIPSMREMLPDVSHPPSKSCIYVLIKDGYYKNEARRL